MGYDVVGYDRETRNPRKEHKRVQFVPSSFKQLLMRGFGSVCPHTMLISWPENDPEEPEALNQLLRKASVVVYLGKNTDGIVCGSPSLFTGLLPRQVLAYLPSPSNTMIIYGPCSRGTPKVYPEEFAGLTIHSGRPPLRYNDIEGTTTYEASAYSAGR